MQLIYFNFHQLNFNKCKLIWMLPFKYESKNESIIIKLSYNNQFYEIPAEKNIKANELKQDIFSKLKLNNSYILTYKNQKIKKNDFTPLHILFKYDPSPLLFINDNKTILPNVKSSNIISLNSNLSQQTLLNIINSFFISKNLPFNASIRNSAKGVYNLKFNNPQISSDFLKFYRNKLGKNDNKPKKFFRLITERSLNNNPIRINKSLKLPLIKAKILNKTASTSEIVSKNDKSISLYNVIKGNSKSDYISRKIIESGINIHHQSNLKSLDSGKKRKTDSKRRFYISEKYLNEDYESTYLEPFMNQDEKYYREKFLDKKNWLNKNGFIVSVGKYKMKKNNFISNYVNATPSEPPFNHKYREVDKNKWINKSGFIL